MDFFKELGITDSQGNQITEGNLNPLMGYQIIHRDTGRILPETQRFEILGADYATKKLLELTIKYIDTDFPFAEYTFDPIYLSQLDESETGFILLYTEKDHDNFGLFK